jgi:hypothetical protein
VAEKRDKGRYKVVAKKRSHEEGRNENEIKEERIRRKRVIEVFGKIIKTFSVKNKTVRVYLI